jgi:hypothetical protein
MKIFWKFMCWVDNTIVHPVWDWIDFYKDWKFMDEPFYRFCQWSHKGLCKSYKIGDYK